MAPAKSAAPRGRKPGVKTVPKATRILLALLKAGYDVNEAEKIMSVLADV